MRQLEHTDHAEDLVQGWGQDWAPGILIDHVRFLDPARVRVLTTGRPVAVGSDGAAIDIVCGDIVMIQTEDGPMDGRCGRKVISLTAAACAGHAAERDHWQAMSEAEKATWERRHDEER